MPAPTKPATKQALCNERGLLDANIPDEAAIQTAMLRAPDQSFAQWMEGRVARYATRRYDWDALKFQADYDPKYRRAQMRYMGTGGTGIAADSNTVPASHCTFSTMAMPAGHEGPLHIHCDVEEVFFVVRGMMKLISVKDGERWESVLKERDFISVPPGVWLEEINIGDEDALMCVMLGSPQPITRFTRPTARSPRASIILLNL